MGKLALSLAIFLLSVSLSFAEKGIYKVYVYFLPVGEIIFDIQKDTAVVKGSTYSSVRWLYNYTFLFKATENGYFLYEKENKKEKVFKDEQIKEKKPWLPIIVKYIMEGKEPEKTDKFQYKLKKEGNKVYIYPLDSKKVKKIILVFKRNSKLPDYIEIDGKIKIKMKRVK